MKWEVIHGDCREVLPTLAGRKIDAVVTDPPYGIDYAGSPGVGNMNSSGKFSIAKRPALRTLEKIIGDSVPFDPSPFVAWPCAFTGAQHFYDRLPSGGSLHCWDKRGEYKKLTFADADLVFVTRKINAEVYRCLWRGICRHVECDEKFLHPTQKPETLMRWMMELLGVPSGATVLDPYCGSGSTGVACMQTGRNFIGIEIDAGYCEIARRRIAEAANHLFADAAPPPGREE